MDKLTKQVIMHGPVAEHNTECPIYGCANPAVLDINSGIFQPCWRHQAEGYHTVESKWRFWRASFGRWVDESFRRR